MVPPNSDMFSYDRRYPPLFFCKPLRAHKYFHEESLESIAREYYGNSRSLRLTAAVPLSNGLTCGEFAMGVVTRNNARRKRE